MSDLMLDVDQAGELKAAFRRGDWSNAEIKKLCEGDILARTRNVVRGFAKIVTVKHIIDCDADPFVPDNLKVKEHKGGGQLEWDLTNVRLHLSSTQQDGRFIEGNKLRQELAKESCLNANVLDYLLKNPRIIPDEWKGKWVFFWGTTYRDSGGNLYVRYLYWGMGGGRWNWDSYWLGRDWRDGSPAAVRK